MCLPVNLCACVACDVCLSQNAHFIFSSAERHFSIESNHFDSNHFHEVNKFIEDNHRYFQPPEDPDDYKLDVRNEHELVAEMDAQMLIKLIKFFKQGKAPPYKMRYLG